MKTIFSLSSKKWSVSNGFIFNFNAIKTLFLLSLMIPCLSMFSQSRYQKMKKEVKGTNLEFGLNQTNFLTNKFNQLVLNGEVSQKLYEGYGVGLDFKAFPISFSVKYFNNKFNLNETSSVFYFESNISEVRHLGISLSSSIYLFHLTKYFLPYVGAGYQFGVLEASGDLNDYRSHLYSAFGTFGLEIYPFNGLGFKVEYLRSAFTSEDDRKFYQYNISVLFNIVKMVEKYDG